VSPFAGKLTAAVAFKRAVANHWHSDDPSVAAAYSPAEKDSVRAVLLDAAVSQHEAPIVNALSDGARLIFSHDYPDRWGALPQQLLTHIASGDPHRTLVTVQIFREMAKHYEYRSKQAQGPMQLLVQAVVPALYQVLTTLVNTPVYQWSLEAASVITAIIKSYTSLSTTHLSCFPALASQKALADWCVAFNTVLGKRLPESAAEEGAPQDPALLQPRDPDARKRWPWWRARKAAARVVYELASRWGQPDLLDDDDGEEGFLRPSASGAAASAGGATAHAPVSTAEMKQVSAMFNKHVAPEVLKTVMTTVLIPWRTEGRATTDGLIRHAVNFLSQCTSFASCWKLLKPHAAFVVQNLTAGLLALTDRELEDWTSAPEDFMRELNDPMLEFTSIRKSGENLLLSILEYREATVYPLIAEFIQGAFASFPAGGMGTKQDALAKEVVMYLIQTLHGYYSDKPKRVKGTIEAWFTAHILPEFASPHAFLRRRAATIVGAYADWEFKGLKSAVGALRRSMVEKSVALLNDPDSVVRFAAASNLGVLLESLEEAVAIVRPMLVQLLAKLFDMLNEVGVDEVVGTVDTIIRVFSDEMPAMAQPVVTTLTQLWDTIVASGSGEDGELEDEAALAGEGLISTIQTVLNILQESDRKDVLLAILPQVWTLIDKLFRSEGLLMEFAQNGFSLLGDCVVALEESVETTPQAWALYRVMMEAFKTNLLDYVGDLAYPVDALQSFAPKRFACALDPTNGWDNAGALCEAAVMVEANQGEYERGLFTRIMISTLHWCNGLVDRAVGGLACLYAKGARTAHTQFLRSQCAAVVGTALCYSVPLTLAGLEADGTTAATFEAIAEATAKKYFKRSLDCKLVLLGLSSLLRVPLASWPASLQNSLPALLSTMVALQERYELLNNFESEKRAEFAAEEGEEDDDEFGGKDEDDMGEDDEDGDDEAEPSENDEEDVVAENDKAMIAGAKEERDRRKAKLHEDAAKTELDEGDDPDTWTSAPPENTPVDHLHHLLHFAEAIKVLASQRQAAEAQAALAPEVRQKLGLMYAKAEETMAKGTVPGAFGPAPEKPEKQ
jgi:hypothetical protein